MRVQHRSLMLLACLAPCTAHAIVIRHDVADSVYLDYANQPQFSGVGQLIAIGSSGPLIGGGTLIRPNWVLTAAHVADNGPVETMTFKVNGVSYAAAEVFPWPDFNGDVSTGDIALVRLATSVLGIPSTNLFTGSDEVGRTANLTGMGLTGTGLTGWGPYDALRRAGQNVVTIADDRFLYATFNTPAPAISSRSSAGTPSATAAAACSSTSTASGRSPASTPGSPTSTTTACSWTTEIVSPSREFPSLLIGPTASWPPRPRPRPRSSP